MVPYANNSLISNILSFPYLIPLPLSMSIIMGLLLHTGLSPFDYIQFPKEFHPFIYEKST